nr:MAG TPA: hypothetical protein [Bacteriophage sp.]
MVVIKYNRLNLLSQVIFHNLTFWKTFHERGCDIVFSPTFKQLIEVTICQY